MAVCMTTGQFRDTIERTVAQLMEVAGLRRALAVPLLQHVQWRLDVALSAYTENPEAVLRNAGLPLPGPVSKRRNINECCVCLDAPADGATLLPAMSCGHTGCIDCWRKYLAAGLCERRDK